MRNGRVDIYPWSGYFTTSAMAEGAIEGTASDYEVAGAHATDFAFSRFNAAKGAPASTEGAKPANVIDASSIDRVIDSGTEAQRRRLSEAPCPPPVGTAAPPAPSPQPSPPAPLAPFSPPPQPVQCKGSPSEWKFFTIDPEELKTRVAEQQAVPADTPGTLRWD